MALCSWELRGYKDIEEKGQRYKLLESALLFVSPWEGGLLGATSVLLLPICTKWPWAPGVLQVLSYSNILNLGMSRL